MTTKTPLTRIARLLDADLAKAGIAQQDLPRLLSSPGRRPISSAAISNWKKRDGIPAAQRARLFRILGPLSKLAKAYKSGEIDPTPPAQDKAIGGPANARTLESRIIEIIRLLPDASARQIGQIERTLGLDLV